MNRRSFVASALAFLFIAAPAAAQGLPRVRIQTSIGPIVIEVNTRAAPITGANFLRYVDQRRFDGSTFYRAARNKADPTKGLVQGGIDHFIPKALPPIAHEPTSRTGLRHVDGTVSMARNAPGSAMGDFFIILGTAPYLDAQEGRPGYAAFGRVISGKPVLQRILAAPTWPGGRSRETVGQLLRDRITIISARRI